MNLSLCKKCKKLRKLWIAHNLKGQVLFFLRSRRNTKPPYAKRNCLNILKTIEKENKNMEVCVCHLNNEEILWEKSSNIPENCIYYLEQLMSKEKDKSNANISPLS